jgi:hypothetical protein
MRIQLTIQLWKTTDELIGWPIDHAFDRDRTDPVVGGERIEFGGAGSRYLVAACLDAA